MRLLDALGWKDTTLTHRQPAAAPAETPVHVLVGTAFPADSCVQSPVTARRPRIIKLTRPSGDGVLRAGMFMLRLTHRSSFRRLSMPV